MQSRLEAVSEQELQLLTRKRRLMQKEIKMEHRAQQLEDRELGLQERETYLLQIEESVRDYSQLVEVRGGDGSEER